MASFGEASNAISTATESTLQSSATWGEARNLPRVAGFIEWPRARSQIRNTSMGVRGTAILEIVGIARSDEQQVRRQWGRADAERTRSIAQFSRFVIARRRTSIVGSKSSMGQSSGSLNPAAS